MKRSRQILLAAALLVAGCTQPAPIAPTRASGFGPPSFSSSGFGGGGFRATSGSSFGAGNDMRQRDTQQLPSSWKGFTGQ